MPMTEKSNLLNRILYLPEDSLNYVSDRSYITFRACEYVYVRYIDEVQGYLDVKDTYAYHPVKFLYWGNIYFDDLKYCVVTSSENTISYV